MDALREQSEDFNKRNPIVDQRWYVVEITPAYNTGGYYDQDIPEKREIVSSYFDNPKDADEWLTRHEPDDGKTLKIIRDNKRRFTHERWVTY